MIKYIALLITTFLFLESATASASDYKVDFTAIFGNSYYEVPPPQSSVSGSIYFSTAQPMGVIVAVQAIDLTISGHAYKLSEIGFLNDVNGSAIGYEFGGLSYDVDGLLGGTDDFYFYVSNNGTSSYALYTTLGINDSWQSKADTITTKLQLLSAVPEPETYIMFLVGLGLIGFFATRGNLAVGTSPAPFGSNAG